MDKKKKVITTILIIFGLMIWVTGLRVHYVKELYVPVCPNYQSMVVEAVCTDWGTLKIGRCDYLRVIQDCPKEEKEEVGK